MNGELTLDELRHHWAGAYDISHPRRGLWLAQRRDDRTPLTAETAQELLGKMRADYARRPVTRT